MIGRSFSHYQILEKLGEGGMGEVYLAQDTKLERKVALKILSGDFATDPEHLQRFEREARAVAALNHPNIVTIYSVEKEDDIRFLAMEFVQGQTLDELIPPGGIGLKRFFALAIPLADALRAAHEGGITHRDLKPANVMVTDDGRVKVLDFGVAKLRQIESESENEDTLAQTLTKEGHILGTVPYMSPEQVQGRPSDHRTDIFSLGIILYEMATGHRPFQGDSSAELVSAIMRDTPPQVTEVKLALPRHLGRIIRNCLEKEPERRFQSAQGLRNALENLKSELDLEMTLAGQPAPKIKRRGRYGKWAMIGIGATLLFGIAAVTAWKAFSVRQGMPPTPAAGATAAKSVRLVVLPLSNIGATQNNFFAEGLTEEVMSSLGSVDGLRLVSHRGLADSADDMSYQEIGKGLGVGYILEGSVRWADSNAESAEARISLQLIRTGDDVQLWTQQYDREIVDSLTAQSEIAQDVAQHIQGSLFGHRVKYFARSEDATSDRSSEVQFPEQPPPQIAEGTPPSPAVRIESSTSSGRSAAGTADPNSSGQSAAAKSISIGGDPLSEPLRPRIVAVNFQSELSDGVLTVYADDRQILRESFSFRLKKGVFRRKGTTGSLSLSAELPPDTESVRVFIAPKGSAARHVSLAPPASEQSAPELLVELAPDGAINAEFR